MVRKKVLVVDDHDATLYAACRLLTDAGFDVVQASTGEDAKRLASFASAALIDVNLPDINGVEVCEYIRQHVGIPVVLMSAVFTGDLHREAGLHSGADDYLTVPFDAAQVRRVFERLLP